MCTVRGNSTCAAACDDSKCAAACGNLNVQGVGMVEQADGIEAIESLHFHPNETIARKSRELVDEYYGEVSQQVTGPCSSSVSGCLSPKVALRVVRVATDPDFLYQD